MTYEFDLCCGKHRNDPGGFRMIGHRLPQEDCMRFEFPGYIHFAISICDTVKIA